MFKQNLFVWRNFHDSRVSQVFDVVICSQGLLRAWKQVGNCSQGPFNYFYYHLWNVSDYTLKNRFVVLSKTKTLWNENISGYWLHYNTPGQRTMHLCRQTIMPRLSVLFKFFLHPGVLNVQRYPKINFQCLKEMKPLISIESFMYHFARTLYKPIRKSIYSSHNFKQYVIWHLDQQLRVNL